MTPQEIQDKVIEIIADESIVNDVQLTDEMEYLGFDHDDVSVLSYNLEAEFLIQIGLEYRDWQTVQDVVSTVLKLTETK